MKSFFVAICFLYSFFSNAGIPVKTEVREVLVYSSGARIEASGEAVLQKGYCELILNKISPFVDENSIQFRGNADFTVISVSAKGKSEIAASSDPVLKKLEDSLDVCRLKINQIQNQHSALQEELNLLRANQKIGYNNQGISIAELEKAAIFFRNRVEEILNRQHETELLKNRWQNKLNKLELVVQEYRQDNSVGTASILVSLKSNHTGNADFVISYLVSNAGWTPQYEIKAKEGSNLVEVSAKAKVWQNTGENWKDVKISMSNGNPSARQQTPVLIPFYLNFRPNNQVMNQRQGSRRALPSSYEQGISMEKSAAPSMAVMSGDASAYTDNIESGTQNIFETSLPYSIRADGNSVLVDIQKYEIPAEFQYIVRPRQEKAAFLEARLTSWGKSGLLPGEANLFLDGNFCGKTYFETNLATDTLSLSFGRDLNISVERKQVKFLHDKNLTGTEKTLEIGFEISLKNKKKSDADVWIEDQIPLSPMAGAEVDLQEAGGADYDREKGMLRWKNRIRAGDGKSIRFGYKIRYPKNQVLQSGF